MTMTMKIDCREALRMLAAYLDGDLGESERFDLEEHLEKCRSCFSRAEFERGLKAQLSSLRSAPVDARFEARIRGLIEAFATEAD